MAHRNDLCGSDIGLSIAGIQILAHGAERPALRRKSSKGDLPGHDAEHCVLVTTITSIRIKENGCTKSSTVNVPVSLQFCFQYLL